MKTSFNPYIIMMRFLLLLLATAPILNATSALANAELNRIIAVVNDDVVMESEMLQSLRTIKNQLRERGTSLPPQHVLEKQVLERLIMTKLQIQMAEKGGMRVDDETLNRTISNIAAENKLSLSEFREVLEQDGYDYEVFREDIRNEIMISRLRQHQVVNRITISDREIDNFLETQAHQGDLQQEYRISHILISVPESASAGQLAKAKAKAELVLHDLKSGRDFSQMATTYSDGQQALEGGDLGWRKAGEIPTLFADIIPKMEKGGISDIITSTSGYHIISLSDLRSGEKHVVTQTHARHILIRPDEVTSDEAARLRLEQLKLRIDNGDDFAELAKGHSNDTVSAANGGDLGWSNPGDMVPEFEQAMNSMQLGELSPPFRSQFGWHIVQVLERREHDSTDDIKRAQAREAIRQRKLEEANENWLRELRDDAYVEYRIDLD